MTLRTLRLRFSESLAPALGDEVARRVYYLCEGIESFNLVIGAGGIAGVDLDLAVDVAAPPDAAEMTALLEADLRGVRANPALVVWKSRAARAGAGADAVLAALVASGDAHVFGPGTVGFRGICLDLFEVISRIFEAVSAEVAGAERLQCPTLLSTEVLRRGGYLDSFPNLLMSARRLRNSPHDFAAFREASHGTAGPESATVTTEPTGYSLPPTMCYYMYDMLAGTTVPEPRVLTAVGKSFRFEHRYESPFRRLWDFTIRETVWVGSREHVQAGLSGYREAVTALCDHLGLAGTCESANDPFFAAPDGARRSAAQRAIGSKLELRLPLQDEETLAAASFNIHGTHLAERYRISGGDGGPVHTGCVGIGLERFMFAFLAEHGTEPSMWPDELARAVRKDRYDDVRTVLAAVAAGVS
jgi:hypothetical protein